MKIKKQIATGAVSVAMLLGVSSVSFGATICTSATIEEMGVNPLSSIAKYEVSLSCDDTTKWSGTRKYFMDDTLMGDSGYATALTARSLGKKVSVRLARSNVGSLIEQFRITNIDI